MQENSTQKVKTKESTHTQKRNRLIFYVSMFALPIAVVVVFYIYVSFQSFAMAFQEYDNVNNKFSFVGFDNFKAVFEAFKSKDFLSYSIVNSLELYLWTFVFGAMLSVFFSYYIYKEHPLYGVFKIILYLPHIISGVVFVVMYKFFVDYGTMEIITFLTNNPNATGLLDNPATERTTIIFYTIWVSFGTNVLMYTSAMSSISPSIIESAELEGITPLKEMWHIVVPSIWPTFVTFMVVSVVGIFTNQMSLYTFFGPHASKKLYTFGYYLYVGILEPEVVGLQTGTTSYPFLSAMGMLLTCVAVPITLVARYLLNKFGPKTT